MIRRPSYILLSKKITMALTAFVNNINHEIWKYTSQRTPHFPMKSTWSWDQQEETGVRGGGGGCAVGFHDAVLKSSGMSSQNLCTQETQSKHTVCETLHMANKRTHLRHTSTYAHTYWLTGTYKTHNSTASSFISNTFNHVQLGGHCSFTGNIVSTFFVIAIPHLFGSASS